ncbi:MAG TPA: hypothetical protein VJT73_20215 [Polyangiaceae bacterium]|nr:hypothetical protein [Polyangiaceae bacterium]
MNDPPRLLVTEEMGLGAKLLDSARGDAPPKGARHRALVALGVSGGALLTASVAEGGASLAAQSALGSASASKAFAWAVFAKWASAGALAAAVTAGAVTQMAPSKTSDEQRAVPFERATVPVAAAAPRPVEVAARAPVDERPRGDERALIDGPRPGRAESLAPIEKSVPKGSARLSAPRGVVLGDGDTPGSAAPRGLVAAADLADEIALLDRAREALVAGAPDRVLAALDDYDRRFAAGALAMEAKVLKIEALGKEGDLGRAASLAEQFLKQYPKSAHVARVRSLLSSTQKSLTP